MATDPQFQLHPVLTRIQQFIAAIDGANATPLSLVAATSSMVFDVWKILGTEPAFSMNGDQIQPIDPLLLENVRSHLPTSAAVRGERDDLHEEVTRLNAWIKRMRATALRLGVPEIVQGCDAATEGEDADFAIPVTPVPATTSAKPSSAIPCKVTLECPPFAGQRSMMITDINNLLTYFDLNKAAPIKLTEMTTVHVLAVLKGVIGNFVTIIDRLEPRASAEQARLVEVQGMLERIVGRLGNIVVDIKELKVHGGFIDHSIVKHLNKNKATDDDANLVEDDTDKPILDGPKRQQSIGKASRPERTPEQRAKHSAAMRAIWAKRKGTVVA